MKKIFTLIAAAFLALGVQAAEDMSLNVSETVAFGDWEGGADPAVITITSAVVKAHSAGEPIELSFANLGGETKDESESPSAITTGASTGRSTLPS